jgi:hypothetical protein
VSRRGLAAIGPTTGTVDRTWHPDRPELDILRLTLAAGRLYAGGESGLWALDARTGRLLQGWSSYPVIVVLAIASSGPRLLVTGRD